LFDEFPKQRTTLPESYKEIFQRHYLENREGFTRSSSITKSMESWMHHQVARDVLHAQDPQPTLEIGAGTLNHLVYENFVQPYDVVEPNEDLLSSFPQRRNRVRNFYKDLFQIKGEQVYKRVVSIATFEHLTDLPMVVAKTGVLLKSGGVLRAAIPNEGTIFWKLGYSLTNGIEFRLRYKLDYHQIMQHEHVNTADQIEKVLQYFYSSCQCKVMGVSRQVGFYRFYACHSPSVDRCLSFLKERKYH
jgi:hypothetical protein